MTDEIFITMDELAARWRCSTQSLRNLKSQGKLPVQATKLAGMVRFRLSDVLESERRGEGRATSSKTAAGGR